MAHVVKNTGRSQAGFAKKKFVSPFHLYWTKMNFIILIVSIATLTLGFALMAQGPWDNPISLSLSPVVLLIAYLVIVPLSIFFTSSSKGDKAA